MSKVLFTPFSVVAGLIAGFIGRKLFDIAWSKIDDEEPPDPDDPDASFAMIVGAALLQGAVFAMIRAATDHGARRVYFSLTGSWPGMTDEDDADAKAAARG